jgi:hypothetical protein
MTSSLQQQAWQVLQVAAGSAGDEFMAGLSHGPAASALPELFFATEVAKSAKSGLSLTPLKMAGY